MKVNIEKGDIKISVACLLEQLSEEEKLEIVDHLAIGDELIKQVVNVLLTGYTDYASWIGHTPGDTLERERVRLLDGIKSTAAQVVRNALHDRDMAMKRADACWEWGWKLWHWWPRDQYVMRPDCPQGSYWCDYKTDAEIEAALSTPVAKTGTE